ncbi:MAG: hypothetical protein E7L17_00065 [Clostridium sp.]|uniref:hypothetical protein n=1 Tax=Clostridium sp. TaxID=1506 RepID=UPI0029080963|nr:hypothetical protein [Clostridium sp.]MDU7336491.1 hypothetical protein [Clostridium sp.]
MFFVIILFLIFLAKDLPPLIRSKNRHDLIIYCILFVFVLSIALLRSIGIPIPSIMMILGEVMTKAGLTY